MWLDDEQLNGSVCICFDLDLLHPDDFLFVANPSKVGVTLKPTGSLVRRTAGHPGLGLNLQEVLARDGPAVARAQGS